MDMGLATAGFWLFLTVVVGSLIWRKTLQRREAMITLRAAIEKGLSLDDDRLNSLLRAASGSPTRVSRDFFLVFGAILAAGAVCLFILWLFTNEHPLFTLLGLCTAVSAAACIILWVVFTRRAKHDGSGRG
jgi:uncharacterized membrane protein YbhN (UPF0104 family)